MTAAMAAGPAAPAFASPNLEISKLMATFYGYVHTLRNRVTKTPGHSVAQLYALIFARICATHEGNFVEK